MKAGWVFGVLVKIFMVGVCFLVLLDVVLGNEVDRLMRWNEVHWGSSSVLDGGSDSRVNGVSRSVEVGESGSEVVWGLITSCMTNGLAVPLTEVDMVEEVVPLTDGVVEKVMPLTDAGVV